MALVVAAVAAVVPQPIIATIGMCAIVAMLGRVALTVLTERRPGAAE
jgi:FlaG/FlaF family flagellin (archaellin)